MTIVWSSLNWQGRPAPGRPVYIANWYKKVCAQLDAVQMQQAQYVISVPAAFVCAAGRSTNAAGTVCHICAGTWVGLPLLTDKEKPHNSHLFSNDQSINMFIYHALQFTFVNAQPMCWIPSRDNLSSSASIQHGQCSAFHACTKMLSTLIETKLLKKKTNKQTNNCHHFISFTSRPRPFAGWTSSSDVEFQGRADFS